MTHQFIRRQLNQLQPLPFDVLGELQDEQVVFAGTAELIQFVAPMPGYLGQGGPQVQTLEFMDGPGGRSLVFNHELLLGYDPSLGMLNEPIVLLEDIEDGHFEFLARDENGELLSWASHWDLLSELPVAVRVDVRFAEDQLAIWPLLATGVKVDELATTATGAEQDYSSAIRSMIARPREPRR
jgi:general secretion pathway protein J